MLIKHNSKIILASSSVVRKQIMKSCGLNFRVIKPFYNEDEEKKLLNISPQKLATFLAKKKALSVSEVYLNDYVIGADQVCEFEGKEIFKSNSEEEAIAQLKKLNGCKHYQNNCSVIAYGGKIIFESFSRVELKMRKISAVQIKKYVNADKSWSCAGSYKYESLGKHLFEEVQGDYFAILGLNIQPILSFLHNKKIIKL